MNRRPFVKLLGANLIAIPFISAINIKDDVSQRWQSWLKQLNKACEVETVHRVFFMEDLPKLPEVLQLGEFSSVNGNFYFYQARQYCFSVFEKRHSSAGLLELMIPFWKRQPDGSWVQITCLSLFDLEALARAANHLNKETAGYLLPTAAKHSDTGTYTTQAGQVALTTKIHTDGVHTSVCIKNKESIYWQEDFGSSHCLTCNTSV